MARKLTERQKKFLEALFAEANGNIKDAKIIAGYSPQSNSNEIIQSLKEEILEATQTFMAGNAPKAAFAMVNGIEDPTQLGIRDKMNAAKELLDRTGLIKTEKMQVEATGGVMLMPAKQVSAEEDE
tara:strand:- start:613 stop:990 length:378 start_codon:yes stop_codon:yes gene_type:complete